MSWMVPPITCRNMASRGTPCSRRLTTSADRARFRLTDSAATRAEYPYKFMLEAEYALTGAKLTTAVTVTNTDTKPIPVAFGFHPAFRWPLPGAGAKLDQVVDFALDEPGPLTRINSDGLIARELESPVKGRRLTLADELFEDDALIFLSLNSRSLRFGPANGGSPALKIDFERHAASRHLDEARRAVPLHRAMVRLREPRRVFRSPDGEARVDESYAG